MGILKPLYNTASRIRIDTNRLEGDKSTINLWPFIKINNKKKYKNSRFWCGAFSSKKKRPQANNKRCKIYGIRTHIPKIKSPGFYH